MRNLLRRYPWLTNVTLYSALYAGGDLMQQYLSNKTDREVDWRRTRNVAIVAFCFNGNFNFFWMRFLERRLPGSSVSTVMKKLAMDQTMSLPLAISGFYTGLSLLEGKDDILEDWRNKFLNTYTTGLMFWPFAQEVNLLFQTSGLYCRKKAGAGKSRITKAILKDTKLEEESEECVLYEGEQAGRKICIVDTPGWDRDSAEWTTKKIQSSFQHRFQIHTHKKQAAEKSKVEEGLRSRQRRGSIEGIRPEMTQQTDDSAKNTGQVGMEVYHDPNDLHGCSYRLSC